MYTITFGLLAALIVVPAAPEIAEPCEDVRITMPDGWKTEENTAGVVGYPGAEAV